MEQSAKGRRSVGHRSAVQEEPAEGRASGRGGRETRESCAPRPLASPSALRTTVPTDLQRARDRAPIGSSRVRGGSGREGTSRGRPGEGGHFLPGPWERGTEGGVVGVGSQGRRRQLGAYLSPGSASSTASDGGARCPTGRRLPYPGPHHPAWGPLTSRSQQPQPPQRRSRIVTAARRLAQCGPRACALSPVPREPGPAGATCDQQVPSHVAPPPAFPRLPLQLIPSPR